MEGLTDVATSMLCSSLMMSHAARGLTHAEALELLLGILVRMDLSSAFSSLASCSVSLATLVSPTGLLQDVPALGDLAGPRKL
jgi:hypothetical protein